MAETLLIDLVDIPRPWERMMLHLSHMTDTVIRCRFANDQEARKALHRMREAIKRRPYGFEIVVACSGADVYVVKVNKARKVVVRV